MAFIRFFNCIVAAAVAWIIAGLFTEETHRRAAGVLGVVCYSLKRFKAILRAFSRLVVIVPPRHKNVKMGLVDTLKGYISPRNLSSQNRKEPRRRAFYQAFIM